MTLFGRKGSAAVADVKVKGTAVYVSAVVGAIVSGSSKGFITAKGAPEPESTPCGSVKVIGNTPPTCRSVLLRVTLSWVVLTNVVVTPVVVPANCTCVLALKFNPVTTIAVLAEPTFTAAGVTELNAASAGGLTSVN